MTAPEYRINLPVESRGEGPWTAAEREQQETPQGSNKRRPSKGNSQKT
jgi:hypothetical protein